MDFIEGLPPSAGKQVIFVMLYKLSKYAYFMALTHPYTALDVAQSFLDTVFKLHGLPEFITSDKDMIFLSSFGQEFFKLQDGSLNKSSTYHPHSDGQTKVVNKCLETYLRCKCSDKPTQWHKWFSLGKWCTPQTIILLFTLLHLRLCMANHHLSTYPPTIPP